MYIDRYVVTTKCYYYLFFRIKSKKRNYFNMHNSFLYLKWISYFNLFLLLIKKY